MSRRRLWKRPRRSTRPFGPSKTYCFWIRTICPPVDESNARGSDRHGCAQGTRQKTRISQEPRALGERSGGAAPPELIHVIEERRIRPERCQVLEEQREVVAVPEDDRREALDEAVPVQEPGGRDPTDPRNARISVGGVADQGEEVGNQRGLHAEFLANSVGITDLLRSAVDLHDPVAPDALRQVLVGSPDADPLYALVSESDLRRGGQPVVRLQLGHGPDGHSHRGE